MYGAVRTAAHAPRSHPSPHLPSGHSPSLATTSASKSGSCGCTCDRRSLRSCSADGRSHPSACAPPTVVELNRSATHPPQTSGLAQPLFQPLVTPNAARQVTRRRCSRLSFEVRRFPCFASSQATANPSGQRAETRSPVRPPRVNGASLGSVCCARAVLVPWRLEKPSVRTGGEDGAGKTTGLTVRNGGSALAASSVIVVKEPSTVGTTRISGGSILRHAAGVVESSETDAPETDGGELNAPSRMWGERGR